MMNQGRPFVVTLVLALICLANVLAVAKEPPTPRTLKQPLQQAKLNKTGGLELQYTAYVPVEEVREVVRDGRPARVSVTRLIPETRVRVIAKDQFDMFDRTGRKLAPMERQQRLESQVRVHVSMGSKGPTEEELRQLSMNEYFIVIRKPKSND